MRRALSPLPGFLAIALAACGEPSPPPGAAPSAAPRPTEQTAATSSAAPSASASAAPAPSADPGAAASTEPSAAAEPPPIDLTQHPVLLGEDDAPLGQTDDAPSATSPAFLRRMELLWKAIQTDDPAVATEAVFFPRVAYAQVKDIKKPEADWKSRLVRAFERNVHAYHRDLGERPEDCTLLGVEVDEKRVKVMARGKEGNKLPYHRVTRSKIRFRDASGKERTFELTSLIAWRGEWFVVHLHGFK